VDFYNFVPRAPKTHSVSTQSANARLSYNHFHGPFLGVNLDLPFFQELGGATYIKFHEDTIIFGPPNAPFKFQAVALFRKQSALRSTGVENRGQIWHFLTPC